MSRMCCRSFRKPLVTMSRKMQIVSCVTASNTYRSKPFHKTFEQKRAPGGCSFLRVRLAFPWSAPRGTYLSKMNDIAGPQWQLGGRPPSASLFSEFGVGKNLSFFKNCNKNDVFFVTKKVFFPLFSKGVKFWL